MDTKSLAIICVTIIIIIGIIASVGVIFYSNHGSAEKQEIQNSTQKQETIKNTTTEKTIVKEDMATEHPSEFESEDLNGNGYLSFDEAYMHLAYTPEDPAREMFNEADSNGNSLLKGAEYDDWINLVTHSDYVMN